MPVAFPSDIRDGAIERFLAGSSAREVCSWVESVCSRRPSVHTVGNWVAAKRRGRTRDTARRTYSAETIAKVVARRLTSDSTLRDIAAEFDVNDTAALRWTRQYWPDEKQRDHAASMPFDKVYQATMNRVSNNRNAKRASQHHRADTTGKTGRKPRPVDEWLPGPGPIPDMDALPDDPAVLKKMLADERDRQRVKDAIIDVLMDGGDTQGKDRVRDGELSTAAKAAVVVALTDRYGFSVAKACGLVGVAPATFYYHQRTHAQVVQQRRQRRDALKPLILQAAAESGQSYGYRRIYAWLKIRGHTVSEKIVRALMAELGCRPPAKQAGKYSSYTGETDHKPVNLLLMTPHTGSGSADGDAQADAARPVIAPSQYFTDHAAALGLTHDFHADAPWEKIGTDVTEIHCLDGKLFISAAIDFYDGMPVAVTMSTSPDHGLVAEMIARIDKSKPDGAKPIIHSDRGGLYRSPRWVSLITDHTHNSLDCPACQADVWCSSRWRYIPSLSRKGTSGDNARTEGFFGTMKQEILKGRPVVSTMTVAQMRDYVDAYIDFYIHRRLKSTLGKGCTTIAEHRQALSA